MNERLLFDPEEDKLDRVILLKTDADGAEADIFTPATPTIGHYADFASAIADIVPALSKRLRLRSWIYVELIENRLRVNIDYHLRSQKGFDPNVALAAIEFEAFGFVDSCFVCTRLTGNSSELKAILGCGTFAIVPIVSQNRLQGALCAFGDGNYPKVRACSDLLATYARCLSTYVSFQHLTDDLSKQLASVAAEALIDEMTGLYNRRGWNRLIIVEAARAQRYQREASLLILDIDCLKLVNDLNGHEAGDAVLKRVGFALKKIARETDIVARLGGDEFSVFALETDDDHAQGLAHRLQAEFDRLGIQVSIGCAKFAKHDDIESTIDRADRKMYEQKALKRDLRSSEQRVDRSR